jgi:hypothetical protein
MMKEQDKIEGLNKRHVAQIIRRNMVQRVKDSKKVYDRKKKKEKIWNSEEGFVYSRYRNK